MKRRESEYWIQDEQQTELSLISADPLFGYTWCCWEGVEFIVSIFNMLVLRLIWSLYAGQSYRNIKYTWCFEENGVAMLEQCTVVLYYRLLNGRSVWSQIARYNGEQIIGQTYN